MYIVVAVILFAIFSYYATWIDDKLNIDMLGVTFIIGAVACLAWPITLGIAAIALPFYFLVRLGANRRGDNI
jgi:hypothetical protein